MGWKKVEVALKTAPVERGVYFIGQQMGGAKVRMLYIGSTHTASNLRVTLRKIFTNGGAIDPWDGNLRSYLVGVSHKHIVVDWICMKFPQDVIGDYVQDNLRDVGIFPRFNPRSEIRWSKKDEPFMQY